MSVNFGLKPEHAFLLNGALVFLVFVLAARFLRSRGDSQFREDLWQNDPERTQRIHIALDALALEGPENAEDNTQETPRPAAPTVDTGPYRAPRFHGAPHEVLGISAQADLETIQAAYKFWIKRYHPDRVQHLGPGYVKQATARSELLNQAKSKLLKMRDSS